ncbi:1-acyl-sn-glycerol-3-phosphate acyltransferase alpha-like [Cloeon dipterum]|uniref:1-acyl-sn-glycerol-3-phosphate acyltransferase alpha-like n=1 Tax=Cloeon dipterum TaxID=197152 RepID=UPI00321F90BD
MGCLLLALLAVGLFAACKLSAKVNYYTRFIIFIISSAISGTVFIPLMFFKPRDSRNGQLPAWLLRWCMRMIGITYEVKGKQNILKDSGAVVLMNHQSILDLNVLAYIWPVTPRGCVISKREVFYLWPFGLGAWLWGTVFIDKLNPETSQKDLNEAGSHITTSKARICMFPEGTRHRGAELLPLKKGAFHLALNAQCPIQPILINNYHFLDHKTHRFDSGHTIIQVLPAIETKGLTKEDMPALMEKVYNAMNVGYKKLNEKTSW